VAAGAILVDPDANEPCALRYLTGDVMDGNNELVYRSTAAVRLASSTPPARSRYQSLYDLALPDKIEPSPAFDLPDDDTTVMWVRQHLFEERYVEQKTERENVADIQLDFLRRSFNSLLSFADQAIIAAEEEVERGVGGAEGRLRKAELARSGQVYKRDDRIAAAERGRNVRRGPVTVVGTVLVLPLLLADSSNNAKAERASDEEVEQIAIQAAWTYEEARGADVETFEKDNLGFDLLSTRGLERRCIEVKGRAGIASVELTWGEYAKATELGPDYWLYVVLDCSSPLPRLYRVQDPVRTLAGDWHPNLDVRFGIEPAPVMDAASGAPA